MLTKYEKEKQKLNNSWLQGFAWQKVEYIQ
jgi:hypothetical protein